MTRVLMAHFTPPGIVGGVESVMHEHARLLRARSMQVVVVAGESGETSVDVEIIPELNPLAGEHVRVEAELNAGVVSERFWALRDRIRSRLTSLLGRYDVLIVHNALTLHFNLPFTAAVWDVARSRPPGSVIAWCHDLSWVNPLYLPLMRPGYPWELLREPAPGVTYVVVSERRETELRRLWETDEPAIEVIPNGIDAAEFFRLSSETSRIAERYQLFDRYPVLLLPVRITRRKNVEAGIRATRALADAGLNAVFLISGPQAPHHPGLSDAYLASLIELTKVEKVADRVIFLAHELGRNLTPDEVHQLYSLADLLLFPSSQEGFGLPILEAGLSRVPAVVSDIPVFREVGGDDVWMIEPDAPADTIASVITGALEAKPSRLYRRILARYRWDVIADQSIVPLLAAGPASGETAQ